MKKHQLVWRQEQDGRGKYTPVELSLPPDHKVLNLVRPKSPHHTLNVAGDPPPGSEFLLPTFISPAQRKLLWAFACSVLCFGVFVGIVFMVVLGWSGSDGDDAPAEDGALTLPTNASDNCTLTYDPDDISELMREAYVRTFFNLTCLATNGTGDPCDLHLAEEYTYRMFSALRFDRLVMEFLAVVAIFSLAQIGGIPRPTDWNGLFFWLVWMATMLAQYVVILCALILQVVSFLGVRARLSPCLIQVDGTALLDFYAMCTFAVQPELIVKAVVLFVYAFLLSLGMLVFDGSRQWQWPWRIATEASPEAAAVVTLTLTQNPSYFYSRFGLPPLVASLTLTAAESAAESAAKTNIARAADAEAGGDVSNNTADRCFGRVEKMHAAIGATIQRMENKFTVRFPRAARFLQSPPISKAEFVKDATEPTMPKDKRFKAHISLALCHYHLARTIVLGASFSTWSALGSPAATPGVTSAWLLALFVAVSTAMVPWARLDNILQSSFGYSIGSFISKSLPSIVLLCFLCPLLSASAIIPLSALFILAVQLVYFLGGRLLAHIGEGEADGDAQVWVGVPNCRCCKWTDALAGPTRTCLSWIQSTSIFSYVDSVLGRPQGEALAFTSTSYATLAGGLSCFWVLLALAPVASHIAWARSLSLTPSEGAGAFANDTALAVGDELTGEWSWVWGSLMVWLWLGAAIVLCCCPLGNVRAGCYVYEKDMAARFPDRWTKLFAHYKWDDMPLRARWLVQTAGACSLFALIIFIFTASQTVDAKERIATTYANSLAALSGLKLGFEGIFPSFDELLEVLNGPAKALTSVGQRFANLPSYAELDPAYFSEGVQALTAINLVLSFAKLLATYGRKLFALMDAAKSILKTYAGHEAASEGDDGTVKVYETMTDLEAIAILELLNKPEVKSKYNGIQDLSFAKLLLVEKLDFAGCSLVDGDLPGLVALVTHPEMAVKARSLHLEEKVNGLVTAEAWQRALPRMLTKGSLASVNLECNGIGAEGATALAAVLNKTKITNLNLDCNRLCGSYHDGFGQVQGTYTAEGITVLGEALKGSAITSLSVGFNNITGDAASHLAKVVLEHAAMTDFCGIPLASLRENSITELDLQGKGVGVPGVIVLSKLLPSAAALTSLNLGYNEIGVEGASALTAVLKETMLTNLNLANNGIKAEGASALAAILKETKITNLNLENNKIGDKGATALAAILNKTKITDLNLDYNCIGAEGASALAAILNETKITNLDLGGNGLRDVGVTALAVILKETNITDLNLEANGIGDKGATALAAVLKETKITNLNLEGNSIKAEGATALAAILNKTKIANLNLAYNKIGDEGASALAAVLKETKITNLHLESNSLNDQAKQAIKDAVGSDIKIEV